MPYTLWSRGRLLGESDLGYYCVTPSSKMGEFRPTELGERVMDAFTDDSNPHVRLETLELELRAPDGSLLPTEHIGIQDTAIMLALVPEEALSGGTDADGTDADLGDDDPELMAAIEHDARLIEEWFEENEEPAEWSQESDFPRYQIFVELATPQG